VYFIVKPSRAELSEITRLIEASKVRPIIEATFPLERAKEAFEHGAAGHNHGKIVLQVTGDAAADRDVFVPKRAA
jgi:NADPH:quinone reductase-like Zn-dependent oxidoreductase